MNIKKENIEKLLEDKTFRYMFLVSLISSDSLISKEDCLKSLEMINYIENNINNFNISEEIKKETLDYILKGKEIVNNDLKKYN